LDREIVVLLDLKFSPPCANFLPLFMMDAALTEDTGTTKITKAAKGLDIFTYKLRVLRGKRVFLVAA
jgi:hypothetical protein